MRRQGQNEEAVKGVWQGNWQAGWPASEREELLPAPPERSPIRRTTKRPFIVNLPTQEDSMARYSVGFIDDASRKLKEYRWSDHALGCSILDGACIWNDTPHEIDCRRCLKALLEALAGCPHAETYVDEHGTVRCKACHFELDQVEDPDPLEANGDEFDARQDEDVEDYRCELPREDTKWDPDELACRSVFWDSKESQDRPVVDAHGRFMIP